MLDKVYKMLEIAKELDDTNYVFQLERIKKSLESKEYLISVIGQFSAGKSKLINNLLGRKVLPVHIIETTAIVTLLKYGEKEKATILYKDNSEKTITIEESLNLWQSGNSRQIRMIETMIIYVNSDILKSGLVLVDTPGVNTIINKHVSLATEIIESSDRIMYVMGKPLTETDKNFMEIIKQKGLSLLLVRTHMDNLKSSEENIDKSIIKESEILQKFTDEQVFFVSNEKNSKYYEAISELEIFLEQEIGNNIHKYIEDTCNKKIIYIAENYKKTILEKQKLLEKLTNENKEEYLSKKNKINLALKNMNEILKINDKKVKKKFEKVNNEAYDVAIMIKDLYIKKLPSVFEKINNKIDSKEYESLSKTQISECCEAIKNKYMNIYDRVIGENKQTIIEQLDKYNLNVDFSEYIPSDVQETSEKIDRIRSKMLALKITKETLDNEIEQIEKQNSKMDKDKERLEQELLELHAKSEQIKTEMEEYPEYIAKYNVVQKGTNYNEKKLKNIGNVLDWVTLFIPGKAYVTATTKVLGAAGKLANKIPKATKAVEAIGKAEKVLKNSKKAVEVASKIDKAHDTAKAIMGVSQTDDEITNLEKEKKHSILNLLEMFTFEHHLKNIGKKFDKQEIVELDHEYEMQYREGKREINNRMSRNAEAVIKSKQAILDILDNKKKAEKEQEIRSAKRNVAELECQELKQKLEDEKQLRVIDKIKNFYISETTKYIESMVGGFMNNMEEKMNICMNDYITSCNYGVVDKMNELKNEILKLDKIYASDDKETIEKNISKYKEYYNFLNNITC